MRGMDARPVVCRSTDTRWMQWSASDTLRNAITMESEETHAGPRCGARIAEFFRCHHADIINPEIRIGSVTPSQDRTTKTGALVESRKSAAYYFRFRRESRVRQKALIARYHCLHV